MVYALSLSDSNAFYFTPFTMQSDNIPLTREKENDAVIGNILLEPHNLNF